MNEEYKTTEPLTEMSHSGGFHQEPDLEYKENYSLVQAESRDADNTNPCRYFHDDRVAICQTLHYLFGEAEAAKIAAQICNPDPEWYIYDLRQYLTDLKSLTK